MVNRATRSVFLRANQGSAQCRDVRTRCNPDWQSAAREVVQKCLQAPHDSRFARSRLKRLIGQNDQLVGMKACSQPFETQSRHLPVAIAARPAQQINLPGKAFGKCLPQFGKQC